jgi:hypothetical protein
MAVDDSAQPTVKSPDTWQMGGLVMSLGGHTFVREKPSGGLARDQLIINHYCSAALHAPLPMNKNPGIHFDARVLVRSD